MNAMRQASTVLVVRPALAASELEILLVQRHTKSSFMGGAHVFPGGTLDRTDRQWACEVLLTHAQELRESSSERVDVELALALKIAAARELFEEAHVLLARDASSGDWPNWHEAGREEALQDAHRALMAGATSFGAVLDELGLRLDVSCLGHWAHWITPSCEPKRFDTHFFLAALPPGQQARDLTDETDGLVWWTPQEALRRHGQREIVLPPPTLHNVFRLAREGATTHREVLPVLPKIATDKSSVSILLPWDPEYDSTPGDGVGGELGPSHPYAHEPSRIELVNGVWREVFR